MIVDRNTEKQYKAILGKTGDKSFQSPRLDAATHATNIIDYAHHKIHDGDSFSCHIENNVTEIGEMTAIAFRTPTNKYIHIIARFESTTAAYCAIYENTSIDKGEGTDLTIYNRDRNSGNTSTIMTIESPAEVGKATSYNEAQAAGANITTTTELWRMYVGSTNKETPGGDGRGGNEWILARDTEYCFLINALSADDGIHNITLNWYEHSRLEA